MTKIDIFNQYQFYNEAERSLQEQLVQTAHKVDLAPGRFFFHEGDICTQVVLVGKGDIRVFKTAESGREITLYHVQAGDICLLTSLTLVTEQAYPASAQVMLPAEVLLFPASTFRKWITAHQVIRQLAFKTIMHRIVDMMVLIDEIMSRKIDHRLAEFLLNHCAFDQDQVMTLHLTHEQIATELNSVREVISRTLKKFERQGIIKLSRSCIQLLDPPGLRQLGKMS